MDGSIFYSKGPDGSRTLPRRGEDGKFHIEGDLVVCSSDTQTEHLNTLRPVLDAVGRRPCIVISPMMRYVIESCCQNPGHVSNRNERFYREDMQRQLDGVARNIKNFLFKTHRRNMRVLESTYNTRHLPNEDIWFCDPVHPIDSIYNQIAAGVVKMAAALRELDERQDLKRRRADSWDTGKQGRLQREPPAARAPPPHSVERDTTTTGVTTTEVDVAAEAAEADTAASSTESSVAQGANPGHRSRDRM
jgi:hypothetical protein